MQHTSTLPPPCKSNHYRALPSFHKQQHYITETLTSQLGFHIATSSTYAHCLSFPFLNFLFCLVIEFYKLSTYCCFQLLLDNSSVTIINLVELSLSVFTQFTHGQHTLIHGRLQFIPLYYSIVSVFVFPFRFFFNFLVKLFLTKEILE